MKILFLLLTFLITGCDRKISTEEGDFAVYKDYQWDKDLLLLEVDFKFREYDSSNQNDDRFFRYKPNPYKRIRLECGSATRSPSDILDKFTIANDKVVESRHVVFKDVKEVIDLPCRDFNLIFYGIGEFKNIRIDKPKS